MGQTQVEFVFIILDVVDFIDDRWTVVYDVGCGVADGQGQWSSIVYPVDGSHCHIVLPVYS